MSDHDSKNHPHDHDDHDHDGGWLSNLGHTVGGFFGSHSHDAADATDEALESSSKGIRGLIISFSVLLVTAFIQLGLVAFTGSVGLLADTIHNFSDALTAIPLFVAFRLGRRAANNRYTYGYRRAEDIAGLFVVVMILASAIVVAWESVDRLIHPQEIQHIPVLIGAGIVGFIGNELVALYRIRVGKEIGSAALVADGHHARADGLTSIAVAVGAIGVWMGFERADPIVGILVSIAILGVLRTAARDIFRRLMDAVDPELVGELTQQAMTVDGVLSVTSCQVRWLGHRLRTDMSVAVGGNHTVDQGHEIAQRVEAHLKATIQHLDDVFIHVDSETSHAHTNDSERVSAGAESLTGDTQHHTR